MVELLVYSRLLANQLRKGFETNVAMNGMYC